MTGGPQALGVAIVLAGGRSSRMGRSKAALDWDGTPLVRHIVNGLGAVAGRVVVVRSAGQELPALPREVVVVEDARSGRGPLEGLLAGLRTLARPDEAAFVCATDMPFVHPLLAARVVALLRPGDDAAVPCVDGRRHPLAGAYRARLAGAVARRLDGGRSDLMGLLDDCGARALDAATLLADPVLAAADPDLDGLLNLNTPAELAAARRRAQSRRENRTTEPGAPSSSSPSQASAVAPASEVTA
jgi:molybdopterin-guanine dinucleotide biosynthesis protein A